MEHGRTLIFGVKDFRKRWGRQEEMDKELHEGRGKQAIRGRGTGSRVGNSEAGEDRRV